MEEARETSLLEAFQTHCKSTKRQGPPSPAAVLPPQLVCQHPSLWLWAGESDAHDHQQEKYSIFLPSAAFLSCLRSWYRFCLSPGRKGLWGRTGARGCWGCCCREAGGWAAGVGAAQPEKRMPHNPKQELGEEKSTQAPLVRWEGSRAIAWDPKPSPRLPSTIKASGCSIAWVQHRSGQGHSAAVPTDTARGWWDLVAGGWDATQCTPSILLAPRGG